MKVTEDHIQFGQFGKVSIDIFSKFPNTRTSIEYNHDIFRLPVYCNTGSISSKFLELRVANGHGTSGSVKLYIESGHCCVEFSNASKIRFQTAQYKQKPLHSEVFQLKLLFEKNDF